MGRGGRQLTRRMTGSSTGTASTASEDIEDNDDEDDQRRFEAKLIFSRYAGPSTVDEADTEGVAKSETK